MTPDKTPVIVLEEHYWDAECFGPISPAEGAGSPDVAARLADWTDMRLAAMDAAGVDMQVLSHTGPSAQKLRGETAADAAKGLNDRLAEHVARHPTRFAGFAALPTIDPDAAAKELERSVNHLGFKGAMIFGLTDGHFVDEKRFWPIFAAAEDLDVPIYLHPAMPHPAVVGAYYKDFEAQSPMLTRAAWGFTVEAATQAVRMVLSGVFEAHPRLNIILGHLGEGLPFLLWRVHDSFARQKGQSLDFRRTFTEHFHVTTSGFFSTPALIATMLEIGVERIMFSVDYPFMDNGPAVEWTKTLQLPAADKAKLLSGNARRLLRLP